MKTAKEILEEAKLDKTVWGQRIIAAEVRDFFNDMDRYLSRSWVTCACGQVTSDIPRKSLKNIVGTDSSVGEPFDETLKRLGVSFMDHICSEEFGLFSTVAQILIEIEQRAIEVASCK